MPASKQVKNGKAFEYALLTQYVHHLREMGVRVSISENSAYDVAKSFYDEQMEQNQLQFNASARATIDTIVKLEPGLVAAKNDEDILIASLVEDSRGRQGDVRDVVFTRPASRWQVGFSAKNNHDAVKHSRLSNRIDFGNEWLGKPCSQTYWDEVLPIFDKIIGYSQMGLDWNSVPDKACEIYLPILRAFRKEMLRLCENDSNVTANLIRYLIGRYPFYKIIKKDIYNLVEVKAFNINGLLNKNVNGMNARYKTPRINLPTRIVELEMKENSENTLIMILDQGWEISFRIHNAETRIVPSLKFDIQLLGNPPILFTQHLFQ